MEKDFLIIITMIITISGCSQFSDDSFKFNRLYSLNQVSETKDGWLFMIYVSGSGSLEEESIVDVTNIDRGYRNLVKSNQEKIDIVILHDRADGYSTSDGNWSGTYLYKCTPDGLEIINTVENWRESSDQEENMGSKDTLLDFLNWSKQKFIRKNNGLIIWNHGGGISGQLVNQSRAVSWDTENKTGEENDALYINEIQSILDTIYDNDNKLDILGFDACYMGMVEIAYEFRDSVSIMIASPGVEEGGWQYHDIFGNFVEGVTPVEFAKSVVTSYREFSSINGLSNSLGAYLLENIGDIKRNIDKLSLSLKNYNYDDIAHYLNNNMVYYDQSITGENILYPFVDLGYLLDNLSNISELKEISDDITMNLRKVITCSFGLEFSQPFFATDNNRGLSIFLSETTDDYMSQGWYTPVESSTFGGIDFCRSESGSFTWRDLMNHFFIIEESL